MAKHLQEFSHADYWQTKAQSIGDDFVPLADSENANATRLVQVSSLAGIPAANLPIAGINGIIATNVQDALAELKASIQASGEISGQYMGAASTYAALPTGGAVSAGDIAILTQADGSNPRGWYVRNVQNVTWDFVTAINSSVGAMVGATQDTPGTGGTIPAPPAGAQDRLFTGAGTFRNALDIVPTFVGASALNPGVKGLVPASPVGTDNVTFLTSLGTWSTPTADTDLQTVTNSDNKTDNDIEFIEATSGVILVNSIGERIRLTVNDDRTLNTALVA